MDIRMRVDPTFDEFHHVNLLLAGRSGIFKLLNLAFLLLFLFFAIMAMVFFSLDGMPAAGFLVCFTVIITLMGTGLVQYFIVPRRLKKAYSQSVNLSGEPEFRFTDGGVTRKDRNGESTIPWGKYAHWLEDGTALVLFPTDFTIHLVPKRCASPEQLGEIRQAITNAELPARKTPRLLNIVLAALLLLVLIPVNCLLTTGVAVSFLR
jgi:hypothetical protein